MKKQKQIENRVKYTMELHPETRNNDNVLIMEYWRQSGLGAVSVESLDSASSILRARRRICEEERKNLLEAERMGIYMPIKYLPTDKKVWKSRRLKELEFFNYYSG